MIFLVTDFGPYGPYTGQMRAAIEDTAPGTPVIDLLNDAPAFDPAASGHLLAELVPFLPDGATVVGVIDPGVGSDRRPLALNADGRWYVGPDNGLFDVVAARAARLAWHEIAWRPGQLSASFHGRDLFAPTGAFLAAGGRPEDRLRPLGEARPDVAPDRGGVIYIDAYGNAMTGLRAARLAGGAVLATSGGHRFARARTFGDVAEGEAVWYENSLGLAELAVNRGSAARAFGLAVGHSVAAEGS